MPLLTAIQNAGIEAIQEKEHLSWFNLLRSNSIASLREADFMSAAESFKTESPEEAMVNIIKWDQRRPIDLAQWPADLTPTLRKLMQNSLAKSDAEKQAYTADEKNTLKEVVIAAAQRLNMMYLHEISDGTFNPSMVQQTALFKALNNYCATIPEFGSRTLIQLWQASEDSGNN